MGARTYRTLSGSVEDRRGRVFSRPGALTEEEAESLLQEALSNPEDVARLELLRRGLERSPVAVFATHRTVGAPDVIQVFLRMSVDGEAAKVFACTVSSLQRLEHDLESAQFVVEDMSVQVAPTARLTHASLKAAIQAWCERLMPDHAAPRVALDPWEGDVTKPDSSMLDLLLKKPDEARVVTRPTVSVRERKTGKAEILDRDILRGQQAYARHQIASARPFDAPSRWLLRRPEDNAYWTEIVILEAGTIVIHGDSPDIAFRWWRTMPPAKLVRSVAMSNFDYLRQKIVMGDGYVYDTLSAESDVHQLLVDAEKDEEEELAQELRDFIESPPDWANEQEIHEGLVSIKPDLWEFPFGRGPSTNLVFARAACRRLMELLDQ